MIPLLAAADQLSDLHPAVAIVGMLVIGAIIITFIIKA